MEMNFSRYKFSKESEPELNEFFKAVAQQQPTPSASSKLWEKILPLDEATQEKINSFKTVDEAMVECIEISDDEVTIQTKLTPKLNEPSNRDGSSMVLDLNVSQAEDLTDIVKDLLKNDSTVPSLIVNQFARDSYKNELKNMFDCFEKELNSQAIFTLWKSIIQVNFLGCNLVKMFLDCILLERIFKVQDSIFRTLLGDVFNKFPEEASLTFIELFAKPTDKCAKTFKSNLTSLPDCSKNVLLTSFLENCNRLELYQLEIVACLINKSMENKNANKLIELMFPIAKDLASNKIFGKLLLKVVQNLGTNILKNEEQLHHIVTTHSSVFKKQVMQLFQNYLQDVKMMSQSLRA